MHIPIFLEFMELNNLNPQIWYCLDFNHLYYNHKTSKFNSAGQCGIILKRNSKIPTQNLIANFT